jgi:alpha-glucuronidase
VNRLAACFSLNRIFIFRTTLFVVTLLVTIAHACAEDGYELWLRYKKIEEPGILAGYNKTISGLYVMGTGATILAAKEELEKGLSGMLGKKTAIQNTIRDGSLVIGNAANSSLIKELVPAGLLAGAGKEGFVIFSTSQDQKKITIITANSDIGVLYGSFHLLRLLQSRQAVTNLKISSAPAIQLRMLNHWDNLTRTVERGYAGFSIWNWHTLPDYIDPRYKDYARANASIGINAVSITNVNANAMVLTPQYLEKIAALADIFRPYGIKIFLTARFSAPIEISKMKTADPLNDSVQQWWNEKVKEIYQYIPDFGGFLVKANSEGQPGPQNYNRSHADGANMLGHAVAPFKGLVIWRAFVYSQESNDRFKQAYDEFKPLDGKFKPNVLIQVKNGPIDFQPREPFSPLFGAMEHTPLMMEFQLTQEYLGQATHLVFEAPLFREALDADTYAKGKGSQVSKLIDGSLYNYPVNGIAGVSNIGNDRNWTGHLFAQANWYALGRLCWDINMTSEQIADEWIRQTFTGDPAFVEPVKKIMLSSREILVNYMTPLGLHHIMGNGHHYGPAPWANTLPRPDWNPVYFHKADSAGIGFDRTSKGTNALEQYKPEVRKQFEDPGTCDERYLLWFHHVRWDHKMRSGRTLWNELCYRYYNAVDQMRAIQKQWDGLKNHVDKQRFEHVKMLLAIQVKEAVWWRNACLLYFQTFSNMPIPPQYEKPDKSLDYYKSLRFPYAP